MGSIEGPGTGFLEATLVVVAVRRPAGAALDPDTIGLDCVVLTAGAEDEVPAGFEIR